MVSSAARPRPSLKTLWQKIESSPLPETEESIILRILVQALFSNRRYYRHRCGY